MVTPHMVPPRVVPAQRLAAAALLSAALSCVGCAPAGPPAGSAVDAAGAAADAADGIDPAIDPTLAGTRWRLQSGLAGVDASAVEITLVFEGTDAVSGSGGCNQYRAELQQGADGVRVGPAMATKRGCMGPANAAEMAWFGALADVRSIRRDGERLLLGLAGGGTLELVKHGG